MVALRDKRSIKEIHRDYDFSYLSDANKTGCLGHRNSGASFSNFPFVNTGN